MLGIEFLIQDLLTRLGIVREGESHLERLGFVRVADIDQAFIALVNRQVYTSREYLAGNLAASIAFWTRYFIFILASHG